ncbi:hypothetical protein GQ53DRAFT_845277 [Thozetella sp. PMI_491]|nr:hypothetical protein GQ53DRAFT_845277 [Thozetella sp. PMI_491]
MLSISFSEIVDSVKKGTSSADDYRAIKLWAGICLHHLQWSATTGQPPTISEPYLNQCNMLVNVFQATTQDRMTVAEILLYSSIHRELASGTYLESVLREEEIFAPWKQKWIHLFALPKSSILKISYHAAHLILAVRALEQSNDGDPDTPLNGIDIGSTAAEPKSAANTLPLIPDNDVSKVYEMKACQYAILMLQTYTELSIPLLMEVSDNLCLCVGYSALVVAHYSLGSEIEPDAVHELLVNLERVSEDQRVHNRIPAIRTAARLSRRKFNSRHGNRYNTEREGGGSPGQEQDAIETRTLTEGGLEGLELFSDEGLFGTDSYLIFPTLEDFFSSGF